MSRKRGRDRTAVLVEIESLKAKRRADIIKCAFAVMAVVLAIAAKSLLQSAGIIPDGNMVASGVLFFAAVVLAGFAGFASTDYARCGRRIEELCTKNAITKEDVRNYERS